jgi:GT2 family glycosyltransferase
VSFTTTVSVVIPTYRRPESLRRCLGGVFGQERTPDEVIVVSHRDDEATIDMVRSHGEALSAPNAVPIHVATVPTRSALAAMAVGVSESRSEVVAFTDDDACPQQEWVGSLLSAYNDPCVAAVGGRDVIHQHGTVVRGTAGTVGRVRWFGRTIGNHHIGQGLPREVDVLKGVNLSMRRHLWVADPRLRGRGAEPHWELDISLRLRRGGWKLIYNPEAVVDHFVAPRVDDRQRDDVSLTYIRDSAHNETYALLKWSSVWLTPFVFAYGVMVGSRMAPGALAALERWRRGERRERLLEDVRAALQGRRLAVSSYLQASPGARQAI